MINLSKEQASVLLNAINKFGGLQKVVAIEEMAELTKEISKECRSWSKDYPKENIAEEIADVYVMLEQLKYIYCISDEKIYSICNEKIDRLDKRIKEIEEKEKEQYGWENK